MSKAGELVGGTIDEMWFGQVAVWGRQEDPSLGSISEGHTLYHWKRRGDREVARSLWAPTCAQS